MRKAVAFAALALSAAMLTSCAGSKTETADTKTYTGSATGMDSVVTATLTMEGDKIDERGDRRFRRDRRHRQQGGR